MCSFHHKIHYIQHTVLHQNNNINKKSEFIINLKTIIFNYIDKYKKEYRGKIEMQNVTKRRIKKRKKKRISIYIKTKTFKSRIVFTGRDETLEQRVLKHAHIYNKEKKKINNGE